MTPTAFPPVASMPEIAAAGRLTVYELFRDQARRKPEALAIEMGAIRRTYGDLLDRVDRVAAMLRGRGIVRGDRIAVISENRIEYLEVMLAAGRLGAIIACQNWRLAPPELQHCISLVTPKLVIASERFGELTGQLDLGGAEIASFGDAYEQAIKDLSGTFEDAPVDPEDGLILLYTSGTTGLPKGALISHRAEIARMMVLRVDLNIDAGDTYLAWSPMFHMGGTDHSLSALMMGGSVVVADGLDVEAIAHAIATHRLGWLLLVPASIDPLLMLLKERPQEVKRVKVVGCMADLVPTATIAEISAALNAPFFNTFGSTETGLPPLSGHLLPPGSDLSNLGKRQNSYCRFRLVDPDDRDVGPGETGEGAVRGPTLFSGYWGAEDTNHHDFRGGWFHMGDLFKQNPDGSYDFAGRAKYLIKSGGENIYPAEIERVLLADPRVGDAIVVRRADDRWGEVPVVVIARNSEELSAEVVEQMCRDQLAGYKRPKEIYFRDLEGFSRSSTGKIIREEVEQWVMEQNQ